MPCQNTTTITNTPRAVFPSWRVGFPRWTATAGGTDPRRAVGLFGLRRSAVLGRVGAFLICQRQERLANWSPSFTPTRRDRGLPKIDHASNFSREPAPSARVFCCPNYRRAPRQLRSPKIPGCGIDLIAYRQNIFAFVGSFAGFGVNNCELVW